MVRMWRPPMPPEQPRTLSLMRAQGDKSIDAIITDLPYGTTACSWDVVIPFEPMWKEVKRILKPRGVFADPALSPVARLTRLVTGWVNAAMAVVGLSRVAQTFLARYALLVKDNGATGVRIGASYVDVEGFFSTLNFINTSTLVELAIMVIGGYALELYWRIGRHYEMRRHGHDLSWMHEPHAGEAILREMLKEASVTVLFRHRLREKTGVKRTGTRVTEIAVENGASFQADIFVDSSYEGDLMAQGCSRPRGSRAPRRPQAGRAGAGSAPGCRPRRRP